MRKPLILTLFILMYLAIVIPFMLHFYIQADFWGDLYHLTGNPSQYELYSRYTWNYILVFCVVTLNYQSIILVVISFIKQYQMKYYILLSFIVAIILSICMIYTSFRSKAFTVLSTVFIFITIFFSLFQYRKFHNYANRLIK